MILRVLPAAALVLAACLSPAAQATQTELGAGVRALPAPVPVHRKNVRHLHGEAGKPGGHGHARHLVASAHRAAVTHLAIKAAVVAVPAAAALAVVVPPAAPKGSDSGLPLPRFAALRSDQVSLRAGPGTRYPIDWVYQRRYLPVKIEREFEVWRLVSQPDGTKGWVHEAMLTGRRGFLIDGDQPQTLRASADETAEAVAVLKPGVVGRLLSCPVGTQWCQVEAKAYRGWLKRSAFYGTLPGEMVAAP